MFFSGSTKIITGVNVIWILWLVVFFGFFSLLHQDVIILLILFSSYDTVKKRLCAQAAASSARAEDDSLLEFSQLLEAFPSRKPFLTLLLVPRKTEDDLFFCV